MRALFALFSRCSRLRSSLYAMRHRHFGTCTTPLCELLSLLSVKFSVGLEFKVAFSAPTASRLVKELIKEIVRRLLSGGKIRKLSSSREMLEEWKCWLIKIIWLWFRDFRIEWA